MTTKSLTHSGRLCFHHKPEQLPPFRMNFPPRNLSTAENVRRGGKGNGHLHTCFSRSVPFPPLPSRCDREQTFSTTRVNPSTAPLLLLLLSGIAPPSHHGLVRRHFCARFCERPRRGRWMGDDGGAVRLEARGVPGTSWMDVMEEMGTLCQDLGSQPCFSYDFFACRLYHQFPMGLKTCPRRVLR